MEPGARNVQKFYKGHFQKGERLPFLLYFWIFFGTKHCTKKYLYEESTITTLQYAEQCTVVLTYSNRPTWRTNQGDSWPPLESVLTRDDVDDVSWYQQRNLVIVFWPSCTMPIWGWSADPQAAYSSNLQSSSASSPQLLHDWTIVLSINTWPVNILSYCIVYQ
jgi:hypothetical protein